MSASRFLCLLVSLCALTAAPGSIPAQETTGNDSPQHASQQTEDSPVDAQPAVAPSAGEKPNVDRQAADEPAPNKEADTEAKPAEAKPAAEKAETSVADIPAEQNPAAEKAADEKGPEEKPAEEKPAEEKPAGEKPAEEKPAEEKPAEEKPAEEKPAEEKPAEEKPAEVKPAEVKPAEVKPAGEKPAEPEEADGEEAVSIPGDWLEQLRWRPIGPASMGGRIVDLAVVESDPATFYVATASGGLFKTTNNGTTFSAVFEKQRTVSIGDVCVSPSEPNIVWVGTGEHNARNSVSWGDGVYRSTDGGRTWDHRGLKESFQIGRIAIHPTNPDIVYVGALGRLWGPNEERGLYKTVDGGETWEKVLHVDDKTGCIDVAMHPRDPETLIVAMYERQRDGFDTNDPAKRWGPGSGLYKSRDGGRSWTRLTKGLPQAELGRIGIAYYRADPNIVYAIVESEKVGTGPAPAFMGITGSESSRETPGLLRGISEGGPADQAGLQAGDVVVEVDGEPIKSYNDLIVKIRSHKPGEKSSIKVRRGGEELTVELTWGERPGEAGSRPFTAYLGGQRANAQEQQGEEGDETGGVYKSTDGGESWTRINSLNPRPFYYSQIRVDPSDDRYLYVLGISLHVSDDGGRRFETGGRRVHPDHHALWIDPRDGRHMILGCDGGLYITYDRGASWDFHDLLDIGQFYDVGLDTRTPYWAYGGLQDNGSWGGPSRKRGSAGPTNADWLRVGGGDGFVCRVDPTDPEVVYYESQGGNMARLNLKTGERARIRPQAPRGTRYRFNWKTPFTLSHHNSRIFYCAGNFVFRSLNQGENLKRISPEITRTERGSATALAESPRDADLLYVGTDDGALWVTRDGGHNWTNITDKLGTEAPYWVSSIECSRFEAGRAYVALDGHRSDSDQPHLFATEDFGQTWRSLRANLPEGSTRVLREDVTNPDLLYAGTEFGIFVSLDRGRSWNSLQSNLPTVAVHEIAVHPTAGEIVAATHGRSLWVLDVTPLRQLTGEVARRDTHLFAPAEGVLWGGALAPSNSGHRTYQGRNPEFGAPLYYFLSNEAKDVSLEVLDVRGEIVRRLKAENKPGLHRVHWDLRSAAPVRRPDEARMQQFFARLDANQDGSLTKEDAGDDQRGRLVARLLERADSDKDGKVTGEEFARTQPATMPGAGRAAADRPGPPVEPGSYLVRLIVGEQQFQQPLTVRADPEFPGALLTEELEQFEARQRPEHLE